MALSRDPERFAARGIVSPVLANIYLDRLDSFVESTLLSTYNKGDDRKPNIVYQTAP